MKTLILDLTSLEKEVSRNVLGFLLTIGLNFRKVNKIENDQTKDVLFIEIESSREEKALKNILAENKILNYLIIGKDNQVKDGSKKLGSFKLVSDINSNGFLDKTTGKKFQIVRE
jgi:hypothetical protein